MSWRARSAVISDHPRAGRITLDMYQLRLVEHPGLFLVMQVPAGPDGLARVTSLLG